MIVGAQLYTLRDFCKNLNGFAEALKKAADIGYTTVQVSGTCTYDPQWLKGELDRNGLRCVLTHTPPDRILNQTKQVCEEHKAFGCNRIGLGFYDMGSRDPGNTCKQFYELFQPAAQTIRENGCYFMYHNHHFEFQWYEGKTILRWLAKKFAPEELGFILDTFWVQAGGANPAEYIREFSGRVPCIHLKDFAYDRKIAVIGEGNINFDAVLMEAEKSGTEYLLVEQDDCYGEDPFDCLKRSYKNLCAMGLK